MHGRMDSDDEESGNDDEELVSDKPDAEVVLKSIISSKVGSDSIEVDPENDPIRVVSQRISDSNKNVAPAASPPSAPKKNVKSITLAERLLLDKRVNDGQRVEVNGHFLSANFFSHSVALLSFSGAQRQQDDDVYYFSRQKRGRACATCQGRPFRQRQQRAAGKRSRSSKTTTA
jgi:hypothetical protein